MQIRELLLLELNSPVLMGSAYPRSDRRLCASIATPPLPIAELHVRCVGGLIDVERAAVLSGTVRTPPSRRSFLGGEVTAAFRTNGRMGLGSTHEAIPRRGRSSTDGHLARAAPSRCGRGRMAVGRGPMERGIKTWAVEQGRTRVARMPDEAVIMPRTFSVF
eukprot:366229-Chlamydomonas_euryale.AAC.23